MDRLTLRRTAWGTALAVVVFHVLAHLLFGADLQWRDILTTATVVSGGAVVGLLLRDSLRTDPNEQDTPRSGSES